MILTIANIILALGSFFFSIYVFVKNKLYSKTSVEVSILNTISQANNDAAKNLENLSVFQHDPSPLGETIRQNATSSLDSVLLAYDYACSKYYKYKYYIFQNIFYIKKCLKYRYYYFKALS